MLKIGQDEMAKYPFLADSREYLKDKGFTIEQFSTDPDLRPIISKAYERILAAIDGKTYKTELVDGQALNDSTLPMEVFSFLIAVILLKQCGINNMIRKFALQESRRAEKYLEKDLRGVNETSKSFTIKFIKELFDIIVEKKDEKYFVIPIENYIEHSIHFHEREWKLVNRRVSKGMVLLTTHETVRLIRRELNNYILEKISSTPSPPTMIGFEEYNKKLVTISRKFSTPSINSTDHPPCVEHAIQVLEKGENLPHSGRFLIATFLLSRGKSINEIAPIFKNAPDYNEKITLYQLNHLAGMSGNATKYSCPSCAKIKTQNLCFSVPDCDSITNPIQFQKKSKITK